MSCLLTPTSTFTCHCFPQDRRDTVSMCAKKGPSLCRCENGNNRGNRLCPVAIEKCPTCADGSNDCWPTDCNSNRFRCPVANYKQFANPGVHGAACTGFDEWQPGTAVTGKL